MRRFPPNRSLNRYLLDENIYLNGKQIRELLDISESCFSKQLKQVLTIPGCQTERMRTIYINPKRKPHEHRYLKHYNLNTIVAIAYRINNKSCREFLENYHRVLLRLHLRIVGPTYQILTILAAYEFQAYANLYTPHLITDLLD